MLSRRRFSAAEGFGDGGSDLLIALEGLVLPVLLPPPSAPFPSPSPEALDRAEENVGTRLPPTLALLPPALAAAAAPAAALPRAAPVPFIRPLPATDARLPRAATPPAPTTPLLLLTFTPDAGGGLAVEDDDDSREARRPTDVLPPLATNFLPPAPAVLERPNPKLPPWLLLGLGGAVEAALPDARAARPPWERVGLFKLDRPPPPEARLRREDPAGLLRLSWRVALPSWTWLTWLAKRRLHTVSFADAAVGDRFTNISAFPSPDKQSYGRPSVRKKQRNKETNKESTQAPKHGRHARKKLCLSINYANKDGWVADVRET